MSDRIGPGSAARAELGAGDGRAALVSTGIVVAALAALNVVYHLLPPGVLWLPPVAALALLGYARKKGLS